jgi:amino acid permease
MEPRPPRPGGPPVHRVRVVLAEANRPQQSPHTRAELAEQSQIGEALVRGLVRTQRALALRLAAVVAVGLGGLPLLFAAAPSLAQVRPFGVALPWLLLGVVAYPFLFAVGAAHVYLAERTERDFTDLVERPEK